MSNNTISLDLDYVKSQFPAFNDPKSSKWSFFENAGGSYVPVNVINHLNHFMTSTKVQPYAEFDTSAIAGDNMQDLKTGHILGATPWKQQLMQIIGTVVSALTITFTSYV